MQVVYNLLVNRWPYSKTLSRLPHRWEGIVGKVWQQKTTSQECFLQQPLVQLSAMDSASIWNQSAD